MNTLLKREKIQINIAEIVNATGEKDYVYIINTANFICRTDFQTFCIDMILSVDEWSLKLSARVSPYQTFPVSLKPQDFLFLWMTVRVAYQRPCLNARRSQFSHPQVTKQLGKGNCWQRTGSVESCSALCWRWEPSSLVWGLVQTLLLGNQLYQVIQITESCFLDNSC